MHDRVIIILILIFCLSGIIGVFHGTDNVVAQAIPDFSDFENNEYSKKKKKDEGMGTRATSKTVGDIDFSYTQCHGSENYLKGLYIQNVEVDDIDVIFEMYQNSIKVKYHTDLESFEGHIYLDVMTCTPTDPSGDNPFILQDIYTITIDSDTIEYIPKITFEDPGTTEYLTVFHQLSFDSAPATTIDYVKAFWKIDFDIVTASSNKAKKGDPYDTKETQECKGTYQSWDQVTFFHGDWRSYYVEALDDYVVTTTGDYEPTNVKWSIFRFNYEDFINHDDNDNNEDVNNKDLVGTWHLSRYNAGDAVDYWAEERLDIHYGEE